ncbi:MAG: type IV pili methyl-accepting chemotaxis transducer N-terminal domain-containing protein, partial [Pseudomonadota bacterium]
MAFKLPTPSFLKDKAKPEASKMPQTPSSSAYKTQSDTKTGGGGFFGSFFSFKKKIGPSTGKVDAARAITGPATNSGVGHQTQKIAATIAANMVSKPKSENGEFSIPLLGKFSQKTQFQVLGALTLLFFVSMLGGIGLDNLKRGNISAWTNITSQLQFHSQRLAKAAGLSARGDVNAFSQLQDSRDQFQFYVDILNDGGEAFNTKIPNAKISEELQSRLEELTKRYQTASSAAAAILAAKADLANLSLNVAKVREGSEELAGLSQQLTVALQQSGTNPAQVLKV